MVTKDPNVMIEGTDGTDQTIHDELLAGYITVSFLRMFFGGVLWGAVVGSTFYVLIVMTDRYGSSVLCGGGLCAVDVTRSTAHIAVYID